MIWRCHLYHRWKSTIVYQYIYAVLPHITKFEVKAVEVVNHSFLIPCYYIRYVLFRYTIFNACIFTFSLVYLNLSNTRITDTGLNALVPILCNLSELTLNHTAITSSGLISLFEGIAISIYDFISEISCRHTIIYIITVELQAPGQRVSYKYVLHDLLLAVGLLLSLKILYS